MLDAIKLEKLLLANWANFIDPRKLFEQISTFASLACRKTVKADQIKLSRFEPTKVGFIIWAEYSSGNLSGTIEFLLSLDGSVQLIQTA